MIILAVLLDIGKKFMISVTLVLFTLELHQAGFSILLTRKCLVASLLAPVISQQFGSYWVIFSTSIAKMVYFPVQIRLITNVASATQFSAMNWIDSYSRLD